LADNLRARAGGMDDPSTLLVEESDLLVDSLNVIARMIEAERRAP